MVRRVAFLPIVLLLFANSSLLEGKANDFSSSLVDARWGGIVSPPNGDGSPELMMTIGNKSNSALWVTLHFNPPSPNAECSLTKKIEPGATVSYSCAQQKVVADAEYSIVVTVFRDEALKDQADSGTPTMRFSKREVAALTDFIMPPALPATFDDVIFSLTPRKLLTGLFGVLKEGDPGSLVVTESSVEFSSKNTRITIPPGQIQKVYLFPPRGDPDRSWIVVEYEEAGAPKIVGFRGSALRGDGLRFGPIGKAITYVSTKAKSAPKAP